MPGVKATVFVGISQKLWVWASSVWMSVGLGNELDDRKVVWLFLFCPLAGHATFNGESRWGLFETILL